MRTFYFIILLLGCVQNCFGIGFGFSKVYEIAPFLNATRVLKKTLPDLKDIKSRKLKVVLINDKNYDNAIRDAIKSSWTLSEYEFVNIDITKEKISKDFNYLVPLEEYMNAIKFELIKDKRNVVKQLTFITGDDVKFNAKNLAEDLVYIGMPYDFFGSEPNFPDIHWRIPLIVKNFQSLILHYDTLKLDNFRGLKLPKLGEYMNDKFKSNFGLMKCKTLLVDKGRKILPSKESFQKNYPFKFEYVEKSIIQKAIQDRDPRYLIFDPVISMPEWYFIYDAETYSLIHYYYRMNMDINMNMAHKDFGGNMQVGNKFNTNRNLKKDMYLSPLAKIVSNENCSDLPVVNIENKPATEIENEKSSSKKPNNTPANTSAIAHGEARTPSAAVAKTYKYKADEKSVEYYNDLRKKFEEEEKIRKEKEAQLAVEKGKKEEEIKQGRRLTEDQAPQFDRFRQGEKNPVVKKTTAEEDYKTLFK